MSVSLADGNADVADLNSEVFRDDHWFVAGALKSQQMPAPLGAEQQKARLKHSS